MTTLLSNKNVRHMLTRIFTVWAFNTDILCNCVCRFVTYSYRNHASTHEYWHLKLVALCETNTSRRLHLKHDEIKEPILPFWENDDNYVWHASFFILKRILNFQLYLFGVEYYLIELRPLITMEVWLSSLSYLLCFEEWKEDESHSHIGNNSGDDSAITTDSHILS